jgi:hypothetical protein
MIFHPVNGEFVQFPWLPLEGASTVPSAADRQQYSLQFLQQCFQTLEKNTQWINQLTELFEKNSKESLPQMSVLRVNFSNNRFSFNTVD